jgi:hypothetical protein
VAIQAFNQPHLNAVAIQAFNQPHLNAVAIQAFNQPHLKLWPFRPSIKPKITLATQAFYSMVQQYQKLRLRHISAQLIQTQ